MEKTLKIFEYKLGDTTLQFSFDIEKKSHKEDVKNFKELLKKGLKDLEKYEEKLII